MWRSPVLADMAARFAADDALKQLASIGLSGHSTGRQLSNGYACSTVDTTGAFPILDSKSVDVQQSIEGKPDQYWAWQGDGPPPILSKSGHLFVTLGQYMSSARLTALSPAEAFVGRGWMPVTGATPQQAKALAVFINSTVGRALLMRMAGQFLHFPSFKVAAVNRLSVPDITDDEISSPLAECWEATRSETVPPNRDGYTDVRRRWDAAVCNTLGWDSDEVTQMGEMLAREPRVRGVAHGQWKA